MLRHVVLAGLTALPLSGQDTTAITNAIVIDGNGGTPIAGGTIVVVGDRIAAVGPADEIQIPPAATVIDAQGGTALPGLADMHVHLVGGWDGVSSDLLGYQRYLNALLYAGVTTVLDVGNVLPFIQQVRQEVRAGRIAGPRIYMVGPLVDGADPAWPPISYSLTSRFQIEGVVSQLKAAGVDAIKAYAGLSPPMIQALVRAAAAESLRVVVDAGRLNGLPSIVQTGAAALAHAPTIPLSGQVLETMSQSGMAMITTLSVLESFAHSRFVDLDFLDHPIVANTSPPFFLDDLRAAATREPTDEQRRRASNARRGLETAMQNVRAVRDAGILFTTGTDAPYPGVFQGEGVHREMELLVAAGLSPLEAITAATKNAALLMNAADEWGTLEPGKIADIVIVTGNPSRTISDTRNITAVMQAGRVLDREALQYDPAHDPGFRTSGSVAGN